MKRKVALAFVLSVVALAAAALAAVRTPWAASRLCALAAARVRHETGLGLSVGACRVDPFRLEVSASQVRLGAEPSPIFAADYLRARLAPIQALGKRLELAELLVVHPRLALEVAPPRTGKTSPCPPPLLAEFPIHHLEIEGGALDLALPGQMRLTAGRIDIHSVPSGARSRLEVLTARIARRASLDLDLFGLRLESPRRRVEVTRAHLDADLALDLSRLAVHLAEVEMPGVSLGVSGEVENLCRPNLDLSATGKGQLSALLLLLGNSGHQASGRLSTDLYLKGPLGQLTAAGEVHLEEAAIDGWRPGQASARFLLKGEELRVQSLIIPLKGGRVAAEATLHLSRDFGLEADATLENAELGEIFERLQLPGAFVMARLGGKVRARGTLAPLALKGEVALEVGDFRVLDHSWRTYRLGQPTILEARRVRVEGPVRVDRDAVRLEDVRVRAGQGVLHTRGALHFDEAGYDLAVEGGADLAVLGHVATVPLAGEAELSGVSVRAAPYGVPRVRGRALVRALHFLDLDLGEASATLSYEDPVLRVDGVEGRRGVTRYVADLAVELGRGPVRVTAGRYGVDGRLRDVFEAVMPWLPDAAHARDALDAEATLRGTLGGPALALDATVSGELGPGTLSGRAFESGRLSGRVERGERAVFDLFELRRKGALARGSGSVGLTPPFRWQLEGSLAGLDLEDLDLPGRGWEGTLSAKATLSRSFEDPLLDFTAQGEGIRVFEVPLGPVKAEGRLDGAAFRLTGTTSGGRLSAEARTDGVKPFSARGDIEVADVLRYLPGGPPAGLHARVRGVATAKGAFTDLNSAHGELRLSELSVGYGEFQVEQAAPVVLAFEGRRLFVRELSLRGANTQFTLEGSREPSGALALDARGALDLRLLAGALPDIGDPRGQLVVEAHVSGTASEPILIGSGRLREAGFQMKGMPVVLRGLGGELSFSQNRVLFDRLEADVNAGRATFSGEVELKRLAPSKVRVEALLDEVPVRLPEWLPSILSGRLEASGGVEAMVLSGKLHVLRARYTEPIDLERRLLQVPGKKPVPKPYNRTGDWLALDLALVVDGDVRIENDLVRGDVAGELTVTGTLASVGLLGTLTLRDGGRATFRGNEFVLKHAVMDFTDRHRLRVDLDVHGDAQVNDYQIMAHLFGPFEDPTLQLTSQPVLSQRDIVTLLSFGYTTRDTAAAGGTSGVATAAAAQALFSASGLDDQVKRFVPRGRFVRDFSVRITSAYSEASGQVEPRAEFESKFLEDRFRLRYQAPLANARGQHAEAEMRLSPHTSLQYQWDNENPDVSSGGDHGVDLKLRWEWTE
ncbi:MAG TPA: translocation/assembly module TamB domain-containing protein [Anaeromyxobacteraceae bacterium]|nr:translocation/assembly module TamB domain-containing protein [Anaeromyxobacteraceae bacterium]